MFCLIQIAYYQLYRVVCCSVKLSFYYIYYIYFILIIFHCNSTKYVEIKTILKSSTRIEYTQSLIPFSLTLPPSPASRPLFQSRRVSIVSLPPQKPRRSRGTYVTKYLVIWAGIIVSNACWVRTNEFFNSSGSFGSISPTDRKSYNIDLIPVSSKGACLNPKGSVYSTPFHPFTTLWKIQVCQCHLTSCRATHLADTGSTVLRSQSFLGNVGYVKPMRSPQSVIFSCRNASK